jgi:hypothetical protein
METPQEVHDEIRGALAVEEHEHLEIQRRLWMKHLQSGVASETGSAANEATRLLAFMEELSQKYCNCAWLGGLEYALWHFRQQGPGHLGTGIVSAEECLSLRQLSERVSGWWQWCEDEGDTMFVALDEWNAIHRRDDVGS